MVDDGDDDGGGGGGGGGGDDGTASKQRSFDLTKFLNRLLGLPVGLQNRLFQYYTDTLAAVVGEAKRVGRYDPGILDLGTEQDSVRRVRRHSFASAEARIDLDELEVDRGMTWTAAMDKFALALGAGEGFYKSQVMASLWNLFVE